MLVFSIIGTLIGAGFASGQEMYLFFFRFGIFGILGLLFCSSLMALVIHKTFIIIHEKNISNYQDFLNKIFYKGSKRPINNYFNLSYISNIIVNAFLLATFFIMISGFGAYFEQQFNISKMIGAGILACVCFFVLIKDVEGVKKINSIVVPILICIISIISFMNIKNIDINIISLKHNYNWIIQAIVYCSYNMILIIPVLVSLKKFVKNRKQIKLISIASGLIVFVLAINIFLLLTNINISFENLEMPVVYVIDTKFPDFSWIYGIVILLSIFSTAISIGISFLKNIAKNKNNYPQIVAIMCISGVLISNFGFSNLVKLLFPMFGYLGIVEMYYIIKS